VGPRRTRRTRWNAPTVTGRRILSGRFLQRLVAAAGLAATAFVFAAPAPAAGRAVPIRSGVVDNTRVTLDTWGRPLDAHDGDLVDAGRSWYLYGTAYGCGYRYDYESPYCGVQAYRSRDLVRWTRIGPMFDHAAPSWQDACTRPRSGCFRPHVVRRPSDGRWVMWVNVHHEEGYRTLVADSPAGPFVPSAVMPSLAVDRADGGLVHGDFDITVDSDGTGWIVYTDIDRGDNAHRLVVERLSSDLLTGTGEYTAVEAAGAMVEAPALFESPVGGWQLVYEPARPYGVVSSMILDAPYPLGPWTNARELQSDSCSGQPAFVATSPRGVVYGSDRWVQPATGRNTGVVANQTSATTYLGRLTFNAVNPATGAAAIDYHHCQASWRP